MKSASKLLIEEPEFEEVRRGYDRNQVNSFLERIDDAVAELQRQLAQVAERARAAEAELVSRNQGAESAGTEQINRTLVLAQRTADAAIAEARELAQQELGEARTEAEQVRSQAAEEAAQHLGQAREEAEQHLGQAREEAEQHLGRARAEADRMSLEAEAYARNQRSEADRTLNESKTEAGRITEEAETEVRLRRDSAQADLLTELRELDGARDAYRSDIAILERHLEVQRTRLRIAVEEIQRLLDDPESFRTEPVPQLSAEPIPALAEPAPAGEAGAGDAAVEGAAAPDGDGGGDGSEPLADAAGPTDAGEAAQTGDATEPPEAGPSTDGAGGITVEAAEPAPVDSGETTAAETVGTDADSEDAFLVELRKAMTDEAPLGPNDTPFVGGSGDGGGDVHDSRRSRFGRRR